MLKSQVSLFTRRTTNGGGAVMGWAIRNSMPNISEGILIAAVERAGAGTPSVVDMRHLKEPGKTRGDVALVQVSDPVSMKILLQNRKVLERNYKALVIGGQVPSLTPNAFRKAFPEANIFSGECEESMGMVMADALNGEKGKTYVAAPVDIQKNYIVPPKRGFSIFKQVELGRGCAYTCGFCSLPGNFRPVRTRDADQVKEELGMYRRSIIVLVDSNLSTYPSDYLFDIFSFMEKKRIYWGGEGTAKELNGEKKELWKLMSRTNVAMLNGVESIGYGRGWNGKNAGGLLAPQDGNFILSSIIIGLPGQTEKDIEWTLKACRVNNLTCSSHMFTPYPGTRAFADALQNGGFATDDYSLFDRRHAVSNSSLGLENTLHAFQHFSKNVHTLSGTFKEAARILWETGIGRPWLALVRVGSMLAIRFKNQARGFASSSESITGAPKVPLSLFD